MKLTTLLLLATLAPAAFAANVTGKVTNKTVNKPAAGDDVVLIAFGQGMQEAARTKTDASGHYSIDIPDQGMHLIRVDHEKAAYFEPVPPGTTNVDIDVYDVLPKVEGVSTEADVMRVTEANASSLHIIENFFIKNDSKPPRTQFSTHAYEFYLPLDAKIEASAAMGPQGMPVASSPMQQGDKGHYAFVFPVRPGETRFQLSYTLPYNGSYKFTPKHILPTDNFVVILPKSMSLEGGTALQSSDIEAGAQTFIAKNVIPTQDLSFTVSGQGVMPREQQGAQGAQQGSEAGAGDQTAGAPSAANDTRPGGGLGTPIDTPDPLQKYKWWILSGLALVLVIAAAFFLRGKPSDPQTAATPAIPPALQPTIVPTPVPVSPQPQGNLLATLKEELFTLETERLEGKLSEEVYQQQKSALEVVLRRALSRSV
jgi:hypothetical protein